MLGRLFRIAPEREAAEALYRGILGQTREPAFYLAGGVEDTFDGRFDLLVLNAYMVLRRLRQESPAAKRIAQALFDMIFEELDESLREVGIGDMSIGRKIKDMAEAFYGRVAAYEDSLASASDDDLGAALTRNLYRDVAPGSASLSLMAGYVRRQIADLESQDPAELTQGRVRFLTLED